MKDEHSWLKHSHDPQADGQTNGQDIDFEKLRSVLRKSLPYILGIVVFCLTGAYLIVRYTKPLYESASELQLDIKREASILGFREMESEDGSQNVSGMSEEIELIRSKLFLTRVIKALDLDVGYYTKGKFLDDEKYRNAPIKVRYLIKDESFFNKKLYVDLLDEHRYRLHFEIGEEEFSQEYSYGQPVNTPYLDLTVELSENFSQEVLADNQYYFIVRSDNALIQYFQENLQVQVLNLNAKTIRVSITDHNAFKARTLVDVLSNLYLQYTEEEKNKANLKKIEFLNTQIEETENKLDNLESYFESFTIDNKTTNLTGDINRTIGFMFEIDSQRVELKKRLRTLDRIEQQAANNDLYFSKSSASTTGSLLTQDIAEILEQLNKLNAERELLLESYNENTKAYQRKQKEVDMLKAELVKASTAYRSELQQQLDRLDSSRQQLQASFVQLPSKGTEYNRIQRNYEQLLGFLLTLQERKIEFEIANAGTTTDFKILSSASLPFSPVAPKSLLIHGIGLVAGLFFSLMFVGVRYFVDNKINTVTEIEKLSLVPVLGTVPAVRNKHNHASLLTSSNPKSAFSEALRSIRTNMEFMAAGHENRIITVTSTVSGEGKTLVTVNLASIIAYSQKRVIVLDLDMRKPKVHLALGGERSDKGLSTILIGKHSLQECIRPTEVPNLSYLPAGPTPPNPSELIVNGGFDPLLEELKANYDVIVIDTPPVGLVTDGILIMKKADLPLYVFRAEYSKKEYFKSLNRLAGLNQFRHMAVILNGVNDRQGYGYGYGYGSGYYEE